MERLALQGALGTIDAIGAQATIAATIRAHGGDDLLALKANRPAMVKGIEAFYADPPPGLLHGHETIEGDHGRIETRRHAIGHDVAWLSSDRRYPGELAFPDLATIGMTASTAERGGKLEPDEPSTEKIGPSQAVGATPGVPPASAAPPPSTRQLLDRLSPLPRPERAPWPLLPGAVLDGGARRHGCPGRRRGRPRGDV